MHRTKTIRVPIETFKKLRTLKKPYETWGEVFESLMNEPKVVMCDFVSTEQLQKERRENERSPTGNEGQYC